MTTDKITYRSSYKLHPFRYIITLPIIYGVLIPVLILDIFLELYHRTCFPMYGIPVVDRWKYIRVDRHKLSKLSLPQKMNCMYCGYVNGFLHYASTIAALTEMYWCNIKHETRGYFVAPDHHKAFLERKDFM